MPSIFNPAAAGRQFAHSSSMTPFHAVCGCPRLVCMATCDTRLVKSKLTPLCLPSLTVPRHQCGGVCGATFAATAMSLHISHGSHRFALGFQTCSSHSVLMLRAVQVATALVLCTSLHTSSSILKTGLDAEVDPATRLTKDLYSRLPPTCHLVLLNTREKQLVEGALRI